jgi:hypothetical protein
MVHKVKNIKIDQRGLSHHFLLPMIAVLAVGAIGLYMLNPSDAAVAPGDSTGVQARRAYDFIDSQGVIAHVDQDSYTNKDNVLAALRYLHVRNVRSSLTAEATVRTYLAQNGIKTTSTTLTPETQPLATNLPRVESSVQNRVSDLLNKPTSGNKYVKSTISIEPFNEYNGKRSDDTDWASTIAYAQRQLWNRKSTLTAQNSNIKILGPSLIGFNTLDATQQLQSKNLSSYMDYGNIHSYYGGTMPETSLADNDGQNGFVVSAVPTTSNSLEDRLKLYSTRISGTKKIVITEMGYHDYMANPAGLHKPTDSRAAAVYMPRAYLENFRIGVVKSYAYQMFDELANSKEYEKHFGFFGTAGVSAPKASAVAMKAMNDIVDDSQSGANTFRPGKLNFTIPSKPADVRTVLLQKKSGKFYLAIWRAESVYDPDNRTSYHDPSAPVNVTINFGRARTVSAYYNNTSTRTALGTSQTSYTVQVGGRISILEVQ